MLGTLFHKSPLRNLHLYQTYTNLEEYIRISMYWNPKDGMQVYLS